MKLSRVALVIAAVLNFALALFHAALFVFPPSAMEFFEAPSWVRYTSMPNLVLIGIVFGLLFAFFAFYALSGAGFGPRLPLLRTVLVGVAALYLLRGLLLLQELRLSSSRAGIIVPPQEFLFSAVAFVIGMLYAIGLFGQWKTRSQ